MEWRPISEAPRDGTKVDLYSAVEGRVTDCWWRGDRWCQWGIDGFESPGAVPVDYQGRLTHWMPLPAPPAKED